ncbi:MAG: hypothetical protein S4CHLAM102_02350 [Chlamydiia bacterium]|nr:hypothetical protein [Chlamydiia bacterium]
MKKQRILISGAGIAGLILAYFLKQKGYTPTIVEKHPTLREGGYKVDIRGVALEVADQMGIREDLFRSNVNLNGSVLVTPKFKHHHFAADILGHTSAQDIEINRWDLVQIIAKAVGEVEIIYNDTITHIDNLVHFEKAPPRAFDIIVGADGIYSNVRRLVFGDDAQFLKQFGIQFCVFPSSNLFDLHRKELAYYNEGKLVAAYSVNQYSYACLAFNSQAPYNPSTIKDQFQKAFRGIGWKIPALLTEMGESSECYYNQIAQVRMPIWSKGNVILIGDAAHAVSGMGTSMCLIDGHMLANALDKAQGNRPQAFQTYEKAIRPFVNRSQKLAESNHSLLTNSSTKGLAILIFFMKLLPKWFIQLLTARGRKRMHRVANSLDLNSI